MILKITKDKLVKKIDKLENQLNNYINKDCTKDIGMLVYFNKCIDEIENVALNKLSDDEVKDIREKAKSIRILINKEYKKIYNGIKNKHS